MHIQPSDQLPQIGELREAQVHVASGQGATEPPDR
jgi:hypothetical protein